MNEWLSWQLSLPWSWKEGRTSYQHRDWPYWGHPMCPSPQDTCLVRTKHCTASRLWVSAADSSLSASTEPVAALEIYGSLPPTPPPLVISLSPALMKEPWGTLKVFYPGVCQHYFPCTAPICAYVNKLFIHWTFQRMIWKVTLSLCILEVCQDKLLTTDVILLIGYFAELCELECVPIGKSKRFILSIHWKFPSLPCTLFPSPKLENNQEKQKLLHHIG
jgi:hypothetical protein